MSKQKQVGLIPRRLLFSGAHDYAPQISPDGTKLAFLAPVDGVKNVWVGPAENPSVATRVTRADSRGIDGYRWAATSKHLLYLREQAGEEDWHVCVTDLKSGETRDLTPFDGVQAEIVEVSPRHPEDILLSLNRRDAVYHDLFKVNIRSGELTLMQRNPGFAGFITDDNLEVRFATSMSPDGGEEIYRPTPGGGWEFFMKVPMEDTLTSGHLGFGKSGTVQYRRDSRGRNTAALVALDLATGKERLLAHDPRADVQWILQHPTDAHPQAARVHYLRGECLILDESIAPDFEYLASVAEGDLWVASRTRADDRWIVAYPSDVCPVTYYLYDRERKEARLLFEGPEWFEGFALAKVHPVVVKARDGLDLVCYYTLPVWSDPDERGRPAAPLPTVLRVHGGPWDRDGGGYSPVNQWLANRGYAVLNVNFRGSSGFGKAFLNAGNLEWGRKMHDDLIDAVNWAVREGISDPERVAIVGASYGGYATLVGLTFTPHVFACGVDIVGPSNLVTFLKTVPDHFGPTLEIEFKRVGDPRTEDGRELLTARSPLTYIERIQRPLLICQGANDPRVKRSESDQIVRAMEQKGIPVTYVVYPDEGHGFGRRENLVSFLAVWEAFLAENLGGRYEPIGDAFAGSSITVPVGAEYVPGLLPALGSAAG